MTIYRNSNMVKEKHIDVIDIELRKLGSRVSKNFKKNGEHILANVLSLACGNGTYGLSIDQINSIKHLEFEIMCDCRHATIKKYI